MQIHQTVRLGHFHPVYCEDALWTDEIQDEIYLAAVMDGCTMGKESHFAASLVVKCKRPFLASMIFDCNCRFWLMLGFVCPFMW
ncbi:MAG: hypothetical protein AAFP89_16320 [Bacteroidota bacterium]